EIVEKVIDVKDNVRGSAMYAKDGLEHYLQIMSQSGEWGDEMILATAVKLYKRSIIVIHADGSEIVIDAPSDSNTQSIPLPSIRLGYYTLPGSSTTNHYVSLLTPSTEAASTLTFLSGCPSAHIPT